MRYKQGKFRILKKTAVAGQIYSFVIECPEIAEIANSGQFVHILPEGRTLRRPISICGIDKKKGTLRIVFEVRGDGTEEISRLNENELIDMIAPLGHGFEIDSNYKKVVLIGGGIGTPPMLPLAEIYGEKAVAITGFRNASAIILSNDFKNTGAENIICTDDGSAGIHGLVTKPLEDILAKDKIDCIYACGPKPMLKAVSEMAESKDIPCQVSLEERMGCGIGACLVCACKTKTEDGKEYMSHVCLHGPVFDSKEVVW
jgi:dihydroorotate dehydrogenase electron transfer subunit